EPAGGKRGTRKKDETETPSRRGASRRNAKGPSEDDIKAAFGDFLKPDDADLRGKRKDFVIALLNELGADRATEIKPEDRQKALDWLEDDKAGRKVNFSVDQGEEDEELV